MKLRSTTLPVPAALAAFAALALLACSSTPVATDGGALPDGGSSPDSGSSLDSSVAEVGADAAAPGSSYDVEYVQVGAGLVVGKSTLQLRLKARASGAPAPGLADSIAVAPLMTMPMMKHGAPVPADAVKESSTPGTYDVTLFFPMASVDDKGGAMGQWSLGVAVGAQAQATLDLMVSPPKGADTTHKALQSDADKMMSMGKPTNRKYMLFRDRLSTSASGAELGLFLSTIQEGGMVWPPVVPGLQLKDMNGAPQLAIAGVEVVGSTDGITWTPMPCDARARCAATLPGLRAGVTANAYVKLKVNGRDYTTDGASPDGKPEPTMTNAFATFAVTPP
ncbi:MAG: hypothetical protein IPF92_27925 [Myxococcales bacterium]|jgi:hypothetical protein|nr:hypothetical protein [Myxococcales bacterium]MBL0196331.1 hypothetical protein [Myxococcales bacterium]HQY62335.1 hypothetical protein [Polyangiaceae bacterium]